MPDTGTVGENTGYVEITANPDAEKSKQVLVRKVRCLREEGEEGKTVVDEELSCDVRWGTGWISKRTASAAHTKCIESFEELFSEAKS